MFLLHQTWVISFFFFISFFIFISTSSTFSSYPFLLFLQQIQSCLFLFFDNHIIHFSSCFFFIFLFATYLILPYTSLVFALSPPFSFFFFTILFLPYSPSKFLVQREYYIDLIRKLIVSYQITCTRTSTHYEKLLYNISKRSKIRQLIVL